MLDINLAIHLTHERIQHIYSQTHTDNLGWDETWEVVAAYLFLYHTNPF